MKKHLLCLLMLGSTGFWAAAQNDSLSWYQYGQEVVWYSQDDLFSFRCTNNQKFTGQCDTNVVKGIEYGTFKTQDLNVVYFKSGTTTQQIETEKQKIRNHPLFECSFPVITQEPNLDMMQLKWKLLDDQVLVKFNDPAISSNKLRQFMARHDLLLHRTANPNLPANYNGMYIFKGKPGAYKGPGAPCGYRNTAEIVKAIQEQEMPHLVKVTTPNMVNFLNPPRKQLNNPQQAVLNVVNNALTECVTDEYEKNTYRAWHIENVGFTTSVGGATQVTSTIGADAKICECWHAPNGGNFGWGIKIAVIDFGGFEWEHEDLDGKFETGVDMINNTGNAITGTVIADPDNDHAMNMSGLIAGRAWNTGITGVAPNAQLIPVLFDGGQTASVEDVLAATFDLHPDIVNMSWSGSNDEPFIKTAIDKLANEGREQPNGDKLGAVLIASAGNDGANVVQYPAAYNNVLGIIGSNPNDKRHSGGDNWGPAASNYGFIYDVAAPGALLPTTTYFDQPGSTGNYTKTNGTSGATAIVSGIAAILLHKNGDLKWEQVFDAIRNNADQVHSGSTYNYNEDPVNYPGKSEEMGYGRVNCLTALNAISVGVEETTANDSNPMSIFFDSRQVIVKGVAENTLSRYMLTDVNGRIRSIGTLATENNNIPIETYAPGLYILMVEAENGHGKTSFKVIKL